MAGSRAPTADPTSSHSALPTPQAGPTPGPTPSRHAPPHLTPSRAEAASGRPATAPTAGADAAQGVHGEASAPGVGVALTPAPRGGGATGPHALATSTPSWWNMSVPGSSAPSTRGHTSDTPTTGGAACWVGQVCRVQHQDGPLHTFVAHSVCLDVSVLAGLQPGSVAPSVGRMPTPYQVGMCARVPGACVALEGDTCCVGPQPRSRALRHTDKDILCGWSGFHGAVAKRTCRGNHSVKVRK